MESLSNECLGFPNNSPAKRVRKPDRIQYAMALPHRVWLDVQRTITHVIQIENETMFSVWFSICGFVQPSEAHVIKEQKKKDIVSFAKAFTAKVHKLIKVICSRLKCGTKETILLPHIEREHTCFSRTFYRLVAESGNCSVSYMVPLFSTP